MWRSLLASVVFLAVLALGCNSPGKVKKPSRPLLELSARPVPGPGLPADDINRAAKLVLTKCVRCHELYDPRPYNASEWGSWMTKMAKKSHLKEGQEELVRRYFDGFRLQ